ncbi:hypothetical protein DFJ74DRAFT_704529 [Hyaloraphidium curvatum]|nr:hypothetical protein DFJ74DRAFT_704529 [Hyaloraphidium curvatum]
MPFDIQGRAVLVTGGTEGIGLALVRRLLSHNCRMVIANRKADVAKKVLGELRGEFGIAEGDGRLKFERMDLVDRASIRSAFAATVAAHPDLSVVIANAGWAAEDYAECLAAPWDDERADDGWIRGIDGNLTGTMLLCRMAASYWLARKEEGVILVTASVGAIHGMFDGAKVPHFSASYLAAKAGQVQYVSNLQAQLDQIRKAKGAGHPRIRISSVLPGAVLTKFVETADIADAKRAEVLNGPEPPLGWVPMDRLVDLYLDLASDEAKTGQSWAMADRGGQPVRYPRAFRLREYLSGNGSGKL